MRIISTMPLKNKFAGFLLTFCMVTLVACAPMSKESYMDRYEVFIAEVGANASEFNQGDWKSADEKFTKFSKVWYAKFNDELTIKDQVVLGKYEVQYNLIKAKTQTIGLFDGLFSEGDYEELRKQVEEYAENDAQGDMEQLMKQAKIAGDTAVKVLTEILNELDIDTETLERNN